MTNMNYKEEILISEKKLRNKTIISFTVFILLLVAAVFAWKKLHQATKGCRCAQTLAFRIKL